MPRHRLKENTKEKIGTVLDKDVVKLLKERSAREGRAISDILQDAILHYQESDTGTAHVRLAAVSRLCSRPFNLTRKDLDEILGEDYYAQ